MNAGDWAATEPYSPDNGYQFNSTGALNTITRTDVGVFSVVIPGLAKESQTQVTTESENGERCSLANTVSVTGTRATEHTVRCFAIGGDPADIGFSLMQYEGGLVTPSAYVWANEPASDTYTPDTRYQFNSTGEEITISRADAGTYHVNLPGQGMESGNVQISAANSGPGVSCELERWALGDADLKTIEVYCFDSAGTRVDSSFTLLYAESSGPAVAASAPG